MPVDLNQFICFNFYKGWREISAFYKNILGSDVTPQNVYILELCDLKNKITMNQLATGLELDGSAVSTLVARMEKKTLLKRTHGVKDRRTVFVQLTTEGNELREKLRQKMGLLTESISENIPVEDIQVLRDMVSTLTKNRAML